MVAFLVESVFSFFFSRPLSFFLDRFLGRELVFFLFFLFFLIAFLVEACFLVFFYKFPPLCLYNLNSLELYFRKGGGAVNMLQEGYINLTQIFIELYPQATEKLLFWHTSY